MFEFLIHFKLISVYGVRFQFHSFVYEYPVFSTVFTEEAVFSPLYILGTFVKDHLIIHTRVYLRVLHSVLLVYVFLYITVSYCFDYYSFVIQIENLKHDASFFLLSRDCFSYFESLWFHLILRIIFPTFV